MECYIGYIYLGAISSATVRIGSEGVHISKASIHVVKPNPIANPIIVNSVEEVCGPDSAIFSTEQSTMEGSLSAIQAHSSLDSCQGGFIN